jgi:tetraacyldisaccharide 4'-kinase
MGPLEFLYYLGYSYKKYRCLKDRKRLPVRVISVGNITVGGTGKTPAVMAIAGEAKKRGQQPCILTRGYKGTAKGPCFISRGDGPLLSTDEAGDEASLMAEKVRGIPIVKGADRFEAGMFAYREMDIRPSLFILDDGFQHWRLHRDRDVLLIDSTNPFGNRHLLPSGILREPLKEVERADVIVITKSQPGSAKDDRSQENLLDELRRYTPRAPIYFSGHRPVCLRTQTGEELSLGTISGKSIFAFCGIGNPLAFKNTLVSTGADVKEILVFRDHYPYSQKDLERITEGAERHNSHWIVTTEKDIMRLKGRDLPWNMVSLEIEFTIGERFYHELFMEE